MGAAMLAAARGHAAVLADAKEQARRKAEAAADAAARYTDAQAQMQSKHAAELGAAARKAAQGEAALLARLEAQGREAREDMDRAVAEHGARLKEAEAEAAAAEEALRQARRAAEEGERWAAAAAAEAQRAKVKAEVTRTFLRQQMEALREERAATHLDGLDACAEAVSRATRDAQLLPDVATLRSMHNARVATLDGERAQLRERAQAEVAEALRATDAAKEETASAVAEAEAAQATAEAAAVGAKQAVEEHRDDVGHLKASAALAAARREAIARVCVFDTAAKQLDEHAAAEGTAAVEGGDQAAQGALSSIALTLLDRLKALDQEREAELNARPILGPGATSGADEGASGVSPGGARARLRASYTATAAASRLERARRELEIEERYAGRVERLAVEMLEEAGETAQLDAMRAQVATIDADHVRKSTAAKRARDAKQRTLDTEAVAAATTVGEAQRRVESAKNIHDVRLRAAEGRVFEGRRSLAEGEATMALRARQLTEAHAAEVRARIDEALSTAAARFGGESPSLLLDKYCTELKEMDAKLAGQLAVQEQAEAALQAKLESAREQLESARTDAQTKLAAAMGDAERKSKARTAAALALAAARAALARAHRDAVERVASEAAQSAGGEALTGLAGLLIEHERQGSELRSTMGVATDEAAAAAARAQNEVAAGANAEDDAAPEGAEDANTILAPAYAAVALARAQALALQRALVAHEDEAMREGPVLDVAESLQAHTAAVAQRRAERGGDSGGAAALPVDQEDVDAFLNTVDELQHARAQLEVARVELAALRGSEGGRAETHAAEVDELRREIEAQRAAAARAAADAQQARHAANRAEEAAVSAAAAAAAAPTERAAASEPSGEAELAALRAKVAALTDSERRAREEATAAQERTTTAASAAGEAGEADAPEQLEVVEDILVTRSVTLAHVAAENQELASKAANAHEELAKVTSSLTAELDAARIETERVASAELAQVKANLAKVTKDRASVNAQLTYCDKELRKIAKVTSTLSKHAKRRAIEVINKKKHDLSVKKVQLGIEVQELREELDAATIEAESARARAGESTQELRAFFERRVRELEEALERASEDAKDLGTENEALAADVRSLREQLVPDADEGGEAVRPSTAGAEPPRVGRQLSDSGAGRSGRRSSFTSLDDSAAVRAVKAELRATKARLHASERRARDFEVAAREKGVVLRGRRVYMPIPSAGAERRRVLELEMKVAALNRRLAAALGGKPFTSKSSARGAVVASSTTPAGPSAAQRSKDANRAKALASQLAIAKKEVERLKGAQAETAKELSAKGGTVRRLTAQVAKLEGLAGSASKLATESANLGGQLKETKAMLADTDAAYRREVVLRKKYYNLLMDAKGKIRVFCRPRPANEAEVAAGHKNVLSSPNEFAVEVATRDHASRLVNKKFAFDQVFTQQATQADVFENASFLCQSVLDGYNVCVFAYGQTGSGKTFTMAGSPEQPGLQPRCVRELFDLAKSAENEYRTTFECSMVEIYMDQIIDLLVPQRKTAHPKLEVQRSSDGTVRIVGATRVPCETVEDVLQVITRGSAARHTGATLMNADSSRSHLITMIFAESTNVRTGQGSRGKLNLVDLAGSERQSKTKATGQRLKEAQAINKSLSSLGNVIHALSHGEKVIPYRDSKLTMVMSDSLGGNAKTLMFVNVSPVDYNTEETINSLLYAQRVRKVRNKAQKLKPGSDSDEQLAALKEENARLKEQLARFAQ